MSLGDALVIVSTFLLVAASVMVWPPPLPPEPAPPPGHLMDDLKQFVARRGQV